MQPFFIKSQALKEHRLLCEKHIGRRFHQNQLNLQQYSHRFQVLFGKASDQDVS